MCPLAPHRDVPRADHPRGDEVGLEVAPVGMAPVVRGALRVIGGQPGDAHHLRLPPFAPARFALPRAHGMRPAAERALFAGGGLGAGLGRHRHIRLRWHHHAEALLVHPPQTVPSPKPLARPPCASERTRQIDAGWRDQRRRARVLMRLEWHHLGRQGRVVRVVDQDDRLLAVDGDFDACTRPH